MPTLLQKTIIDKEKNLYPTWLMRQAGRYMPEYMAVKKASKGFLDMALTPTKARDITMQPINAFNMDAAIIFSDILVIPFAIGQELDYVPAPVLGPFTKDMLITPKSLFLERCQPVYEAIKMTRKELDNSKSLIGFAGAPWTLYRYMNKLTSSEQADENTEWCLDRLADYIILHLSAQIEAGCDTIQIFESWAQDIQPAHLNKCCYDPTAKIVDRIRNLYPEVGIICFPRLIGNNISDYCNWVKPDCVSFSEDISFGTVKNIKNISYQGGINPNVLLEKDLNFENISFQLEQMKDQPYVVNLAHGVNKETNPDHVKQFVDQIKSYR